MRNADVQSMSTTQLRAEWDSIQAALDGGVEGGAIIAAHVERQRLIAAELERRVVTESRRGW